ncbi:MAG: DUF58 domain-containing protein [Gammaproteobacteria bacterium]
MIPARSLLVVLALLGALGVLVALWPEAGKAWSSAMALVGIASFLDAALVWRPRKLKLERELPGSMAVGVWRSVPLIIRNQGRLRERLQVFDHCPGDAEIEQLPQTVSVSPGAWVRVEYRVRIMNRGDALFRPAQLRRLSPMGLWWRTQFVGEAHTVRVYPNYRTVVEYALLATEHRLSQMGVRKRQRRGEGMDFHQLREFREGDSPHQVDWKATSRAQKLISREYQDERDQEMVFLVDSGRRMLAHDGPLSHFDHTLNAIILLGYVALRQGDAVGLSSFAGDARWMKPIKGVSATQSLLNQLYDLHPSLTSPDYAAAARELLVRQRRRALVILITNLRDEDPEELIPAIRLLRARHLVVVASLREQAVDQAAETEVQTLDDALLVSASIDYLRRRRGALNRLNAEGVLCLDVTPDQLAISLVNRYLDIKASGAL